METAFFATAQSYGQLHAALRCRADQLNVSRVTIDAETGLADGYASKCLAPKPIKGISKLSLEPMLKALGLRLLIIDEPASPASRGELPQRDASQVRMCNDSRRSKGRAQPAPKPVRKLAKPKRGKPYLSTAKA